MQCAVSADEAALAAVGERFDVVPHRGRAVPQRDAAFRRFIKSGDAVEDGRLARAVRADQGGDLALARLEREIVDSGEPAEAHGQVLDAQEGGHYPRPWPTRSAPIRLRCFRNTEGARVEISPRG